MTAVRVGAAKRLTDADSLHLKYENHRGEIVTQAAQGNLDS
jgi:hypothetical protein